MPVRPPRPTSAVGAGARLRLPVGGYGPASGAHGRGLEVFRREMETGAGGRVEVPVTWNILDAGLPAASLLDMVEAGEMFLCYFSTSYLGERIPALNVLEIPYLFDDLDHAHRALDGELGSALAEAIRAGSGFEVLGFWDNGFRHLTNRLRPVLAPEDCLGMRVRLQPNPLHAALMEAWGAVPVAVDLAEGVELIRSGGVDAQENPLANTVAYGVDRVHRYVTLTGHLYGARGLFVHRPTLEALPDDLRRLVRQAARDAVHHQRRLAAVGEQELRRRLEGEGVEFVDLTPDQRERFVLASRPAVEAARRLVGAGLLEMVES